MGPAPEPGGVQGLSQSHRDNPQAEELWQHERTRCPHSSSLGAYPVLVQLRGRSAESLRDSTYGQQGRGSGFAAPPFAAAPNSERSSGGPGGAGLETKARGCGTRKSAAAEAVSVRRVTGASGLRSWRV